MPLVLGLRQFLDAGCIDTRKRVAHTDARNHAVGGDLGKRHQHESALEQARMRQRQVRAVQGEIVIGEEVEIDRARSPALLVLAVAAERAFDLDARANRSRGGSVVATAMTALTKGG